MDHLAIPVSDRERSRQFYESYCGFGAKPARTDDDGVLMLYNAAGFALALGPIVTPSSRSRTGSRTTVSGLVEHFDEPDYVSIKFRDPDGYIIEASWEPS